MSSAKIIWTKIDEAPALATYSLLPVVQAFTKGTGVEVETRDISLAGRIIANFPDKLTADQTIADELTRLGELAQKPEATSSSCPTSAPRFPSCRRRSRSCRSTATPSRITPRSRATTRRRPCRPATPRCWLGREPGAARGTRTAAPPPRSSATPRRIPTA